MAFTMKKQTEEILKEIKQSLRQLMNGTTAQSMRDKGVVYYLNWGASIGHLREMAEAYGQDYELAVELWKENIRECKILATMIMPADSMLTELAELWMEQTPSQEIAEQAAFNLYQYLDAAPVLAYKWIASDRPLYQICGYQLLARLFSKGSEPNDRGISEMLDQALTALHDEHLGVRHAALACVRRFASLGPEQERIAENALKSIGLELF